MGPLSSPNNESHSQNKTHRRLGSIFLLSDWFTGPEEENWSAGWGGDRWRFQKETRTHKLCQPENVAVGPIDNVRLGDRATLEKLQCHIKHHQNESRLFLPLNTIKWKNVVLCPFYLHDAICRVLNEKIQDAVIIEVSWNRLPAKSERETIILWHKDDEQIMTGIFFLEEAPLPAVQGTRYGAVVTGWIKKWYTSKVSVRAVRGFTCEWEPS